MRFFIFSFSFVFLSLACAESEKVQTVFHDVNVVEESKELPVLVPLKVGNAWRYRDVKTGTILDSSVLSAQSVNGVEWFQYKELGDTFWVRNEGLSQFEAMEYFGQPRIYSSIKEETLVLTIYKLRYEFPGVEQASYQQCKKKIVVPAGSFDCHILTFDLGKGLSLINYYAENIGLIKNVYKTEDENSEIELVEYTLK